MKIALSAFAVMILASPFVASADTTYSYPKSAPVFSIAFPDDWNVDADPEDENGLVATSKDEEIELDLWALEKVSDPKQMVEQFEETGKTIGAEINKYVTGFKVEESKKGSINGISAAMFGGTGKSKEDGEEVNVEVTLLSPDGKQVFALMYWGSEEAEAANKAALDKIGGSIKKP